MAESRLDVDTGGMRAGLSELLRRREAMGVIHARAIELASFEGTLKAAGDDPAGRAFTRVQVETARGLAADLGKFCDLLDYAIKSIRDAAQSFDDVDKSSADAAKKLGEGVTGVTDGQPKPGAPQPVPVNTPASSGPGSTGGGTSGRRGR